MEQDISNNIFVKAKFYIPDEKKYRYLKLRIAPSSIQNAGMGVYAVDEIPKGARGAYIGVKKSMTRGNAFYSWIIYEYDTVTGNSITTKELYMIDASNKKVSNWTRYVNCGMYDLKNNLEPVQKWEDLYYVSRRDINPGEELWIDYGEGFRNRLNDMDNENYYYG